MPIGVQWMYWGGAIGVALGLLIGSWALAGDWLRHRGRRRRCPGCWYDMEGVPGQSCPECGRVAKHERQLRRSRRRWGWIAAVLMLAPIEIAGIFNVRLAAVNWPTYTPSWLLVRIVNDPAPPPQPKWTATGSMARPVIDPFELEMWRRYTAGSLSIAQRRIVASRQFKASRPPLTLETRARWPANVPVTVVLHSGFSGPLPRELRATTDLHGSEPIVAYESGWQLTDWGVDWWLTSNSVEHWRQVLGTPPAQATSIPLRITIQEGGQLLWSGTLDAPIKITGAVDDIIAADSSPALTGAIRNALTTSLSISADGRSLSFIRPPDLHDATLGLIFEFMRSGRVIATAHAAAAPPSTDNSNPWPETRSTGPVFASIQGDSGALVAAVADPRSLTVRVTGDPQLALQDFTSIKYWAGKLEFLWSAVHADP